MGVAFGMKKGFIFSLDGMVAIAAIVAILSVWVFMPKQEGSPAMRALDLNAQDYAAVGIYTKAEYSHTVDWGSEKYVVCKKYFIVENAAIGTMQEYNYCTKVK